MKRTMVLGALALLLLLALPMHAYAAAKLQSSTVTRVSGAEIAREVLAQTKGVQLGANAVTVTMDVNGTSQPMRLEFGDFAKGLAGSGSGSSGLLGLAALPVAAGVFFKILGFLAHLGR